MIFVVGARRSGTFWLQRIVTSHPEIAAVPSETALFSQGIAPLFERFHHGSRSTPRVGSLYSEREALLDATRDLCDVGLRSHAQPDSRYLAERTADHVRHVDLIAEVYPDGRVLHIIRDGRDVSTSLLNQPWGPDGIVEAAEEWASCVRAARRARLGQDRYMEVRYEDLAAEPERNVRSVFEWLGVSTSRDVVDQALIEARTVRNVGPGGSGGRTGKWLEAFGAQDAAAFDRVAGDLLEELGYPPTGSRPPQRGRPGEVTRRVRRLASRAVAQLRRRDSLSGAQHLSRRLLLSDRAVSALLERRFEDLAALCAPEVFVALEGDDGVQELRGSAGLRVLAERISADRAIAGRQIRGDTHPGAPTTGYVLRFESDSGRHTDRVVFVTSERGQVTRLVVYLMPSGNEASGQ
jgi:hypothetical protein